MPRPFPQPVNRFGDSSVQRIERHSLWLARERYDQTERRPFLALLPKGITRKCEAGLVRGRRAFGPDHQMWLSLAAFLAVRQGIAGGLKIIGGNDNGVLKGELGKISDSPVCRSFLNDDLVFVRVRPRAAPQEKKCFSRTLLISRDQFGCNHRVASTKWAISLAFCLGYNRDTSIIFAALLDHRKSDNDRHAPYP